VVDGPPVVDLAFLALAHEALELLLELGILAPPQRTVGRILESLDGEVDLPVFLDGDDLGLNSVVLPKVVPDLPDVVPIDLRDVYQADGAIVDLDERSVRGDALDGPFDDRPDLQVYDGRLLSSGPFRARPQGSNYPTLSTRASR
jgi:hypothetical protein